MSKKIVAMLMAVAMAFSLLPVTAFATDGTPEKVTASENNLTMNKTVTPKGDGTYTVSLESYATGSVTTTQAPVPMDFVLVLDVSGSMDGENGQIASYGYQETKKTSWSAKDFYLTGTTQELLTIQKVGIHIILSPVKASGFQTNTSVATLNTGWKPMANHLGTGVRGTTNFIVDRCIFTIRYRAAK